MVHAQETWGIANSNFAGNMGIGINPSSIVGAPYKREFLLVAADIFGDNNYLYLRKNSGLVTRTINGEAIGDDRIDDYYTEKPLKRAYLSTYLMGPSYIRNYGKWAWGAHIQYRQAVSANKVPLHLAKFIYEGFGYVPQHNIRYTSGPFTAASLGWLEIGGTYAKILKSTNNDKNVIKAGITGNFLLGTNGIYISTQSIDYIVPNSQLLIVNKLEGEYAHASPQDRDSLLRNLFKIRGMGASFNIGATYIRGMNRAAYDCNATSDKLQKYNYRIGVSLIDLGMIKFNHKQTRVNSFTGQSAYWPGIDTVQFYNWFYMDTLLSNRFYGDPKASKTGEEFSMFLPLAFSVQFDYNIKPRYYINASVVQRIALNDRFVRRPNQVSITGRYETRKFELAVPLSFFEYKQLGFGIALRYGILVIGTDRLGTFTGLVNATGFDFFFGIKWNSCDVYKRKSKTGCDL